MKKLILTPVIIMSFSLLFMTSCEKEKILSEFMIGKWEAEFFTQFIYENNELQAELKQYLKTDDLAIQFVEGGSGIYTESGDDYLFSWTLDGNSVTIEDLFIDIVVWKIEMNGDKLLWSYSGINTEDPTVTYDYFFTAKRVD